MGNYKSVSGQLQNSRQGVILLWRQWKLSSLPSSPLSIYVQSFSTPLTNFIRTLPFSHNPLQIITNQLKENIIQGWLFYVIRSFLQVGFRFHYQLIDFVWISFYFFSFSWSPTVSFFVALYSCVCSCSQIS